MSTQKLAVFNETGTKFNQQFANRYSIYCNDPYEYKEVNFDLIAKLADDLGAVNPTIARRIGANGQYSAYLTADNFTVIEDQLKEKNCYLTGNTLSDGSITYLIEVEHDCFYQGYPVLFWKKEDINEKDRYGEMCFTKTQEDLSSIDKSICNQEALIAYFEEELKKSNAYKALEFAQNYLNVLKNQKEAKEREEIAKKVKEFDDLMISVRGDKNTYLQSKGFQIEQHRTNSDYYWVHSSVLEQWIKDINDPYENFPEGTVFLAD